jgi:predicted nucleic-acid-binding protein
VIALDTNVLVRYIVRDDPKQATAATRFIESNCSAEDPGILTLIVLCEFAWVLERGYRYKRDQISAVLRKILTAEDLQVERAEVLWQALNAYDDGKADFADYVIGFCGKELKAEATVTFDQSASESPLFRMLSA